MNSIEKLAMLLHDSWRKTKIEVSGWHLPEKCPYANPYNCHTCLAWGENDMGTEGCRDNKKGCTDPPTGCKDYTHKRCRECHPCVNEWEKLTSNEKEAALQNSKIAHQYFNTKKKKI